MPGSYGVFDDVVEAIIAEIKPQTLLDIGTGAGKYGKMLRSIAPDCRRVGVEMEPSYIRDYQLAELYHEIRPIDAATLMTTTHDEFHDLVILGDCIEHMPKSTGLDLLNFLTYRAKYVLVLVPEFCIQGSVNGVGSESHVSVWSEADFAWHDAWAFENAMTVSLFLLRGYQPNAVPLTSVIDAVNKKNAAVMDFNRERFHRPAHLTAHIRRRVEMVNGQEYCFRVK